MIGWIQISTATTLTSASSVMFAPAFVMGSGDASIA